MANKKDLGVSLKTPQQVWDYYCVVGNFSQSKVEEDAESWITSLFTEFSEEEFETVIRNSAGAPAYAVFDATFFRTVLEKVKMKEEMEKMKKDMESLQSVDRTTANSLDLLTHVVAKTMEDEVKKVTMSGLQDEFKNWVDSNYGPSYIAPKIYVKPTGEPISGVVNVKFGNVLRWVALNTPVLLTGPAGCGKNVLVSQIAEHLGMPFVVLNRIQDAAELQGFKTVDGEYAITPFIHFCKDCIEKDIDGIVLFDEIDGSDANALIAINDAVSSRAITLADNSHLDLRKIHFMACANTWGTGATDEYVGRNQLDSATLNRFRPVEIDYDPKVEESICTDKVLLKFFREFREATKKCGIRHIVSYRNLKSLVDAFDYEKDNLTHEVKKDILKEALVENLTRDDLSQIYPKLDYSDYRGLIEELAGY